MRPGEGGVHRRGGLKALVSMGDGMKYEYDVPDNIDSLVVDAIARGFRLPLATPSIPATLVVLLVLQV